MTDVVILCWSMPEESACGPHKILNFLGVQATFVVLATAGLADAESVRRIVPECTCLIADAETLAKAAQVMGGGVDGLRRLLTDVAEHVFVYGFQANEGHDDVLSTLSSGAIRDVRPLRVAAKFEVAGDHRQWCGQFSGLSLEAPNAATERHFVEAAGEPGPDAIIRVGNKPFFVRAKLGGTQVFLSASTEVADLDEKVGRDAGVLSWFSRLIPLMMFLRGALGNRVWHNDNPRACFIIDDPLLKDDRYGFLQYGRLVESMRQRKFSTSIAFIPWNYRRSGDGVSTLFSSNGDVPSLCIHGCDHTGGEFATTDSASLRTKAQMALERMRIHRRLSGVPFDDVMVFPQGLFSAEAMAALKASGYLAAVNTDLFPSTQPETLLLRDLLDVAVTRFADFPVFGRRYPRDLAEFAFDLFLGKPVLAVEHHGYFRNGYAALESFVEQLNNLDERLEWSDLGTICSRACLTRTVEGGDVHVRFYTDRFRLTNAESRTRNYLLSRQHTLDGLLPVVTIDGQHSACEREGRDLKIRLSLDPGQAVDIRVSPDGPGPRPSRTGTPIQHARVWIRRLLSEFRDNHMDTNRVLSAVVATARSVRRDVKPQPAP
jgi:hypothetical protein